MSVVSGIVGASASKRSAQTQASAATQAAQTSSEATERAAKLAADSQKYAVDIQKKVYDQTRADQTQWRNAGVNALSQLTAGTKKGGNLIAPYKEQKKFTLADFEADPGYNFRLKEGVNALDRSAAARGGLFSGAQGKAMTKYGQDYGSNEYSNAYNRYQSEYQNAYNRYQSDQTSQYNRLASMAGLGQTANNALQSAGNTYANSVGQYAMGNADMTGNLLMGNAANVGNAQLAAGQARASAYQGQGAAASGAAKAVTSLYGDEIKQWGKDAWEWIVA